MILIEFASSGYSKGASLNAGVSFLWESTERLNESLSYNYGCQVITGVGYVEYKNDDEAFQNGIEKLAKKALEKVDEYRKFSDMDYAKSCFILGIVILNGMNNFITIVLKTFNVTYLQRNLHNRWL